MAPNSALRERFDNEQARDPREQHGGAEVIDLTTRNVLPTVTQRKKGDGLGLVAGVAIVAALGGLTLWSMDAARNPDPVQVQAPVAAAPVVPPAAITPVPSAPVLTPNAAPAPLPAPAPQAVLAAPPGAAVGVQGNPAASPTVVFDAAGGAAPAADAAGKADFKGGNPNEDFAARLGGLGGASASAKRSFDPATTVTQGTLIPAVLETAIDTDVPGFVRAMVSADVRSFDGRTVLVPRSSRLIGQYKSGLSAGQKRAYVIWTRLIRPDGVSVDLGSPAIAFGGETGLAGKVNSHFFERFGSGMLLSVLGGLPSLLGNNSSVIVGGGGSSAASAAVQQGGQVGPTIRVRQGQPIRVFTAKDLDFSKTK